MQPLFIGTVGVPELLIIFAILFFIFGAKKLPALASGLGSSIRNFKKGVEEGEDDNSRGDA